MPTVVAADAAPALVNTDNPTTALTSITQGTADTGALKVLGNGTGTALEVVAVTGVALKASNAELGGAAAVVIHGDPSGAIQADALPFGAYAYSSDASMGAGVVGDALEGIGVLGHGGGPAGIGVTGIGAVGGYFVGSDGIEAQADLGGTGIHVHVGSATVTPPANTAISATVDNTTMVGIEARGRIRFPNRSGRATIAAGHSTVTVAVSGMTSSNFAMAVLNTNRSGRWVRAVVCATGKITIYLNTTVSSSTYVSWLVLG